MVPLGSGLKVCCCGRGMGNDGCEGSVKVVPETVVTGESCGTVVEDPCFLRSLLWLEWWVKTWLMDSRETVYR